MDDMPMGGRGGPELMIQQIAMKGLQLAQILPYIVLPVLFLVFSYAMITIDRRREGSTNKDDTQVGLKLVLFGLALAGISVASDGIEGLLGYVLGGFKGGAGPIKLAIPPILVGGGVTFAILTMMLPRTNTKTAPQAERFAVGVLGVVYGAIAIGQASIFLNGLFNSMPWGFITAPALAGLLTSGAIGFLALNRLGSLSSWSAPQRPAAPMAPAGYPSAPAGGYGGQQGGGYPPQGGGYPPQGGGYPPQGGGYPPQQGGGGYPPQGGGGYPPR
jgi:hypothetical protein